MKSNLAVLGIMSLTALAMQESEGRAGFLCCNNRGLSQYSMYIACRPYNAFSPVCTGAMECVGCCPFNMGGHGGGGCNPCCPPPPPSCCPPACPDGGCGPAHHASYRANPYIHPVGYYPPPYPGMNYPNYPVNGYMPTSYYPPPWYGQSYRY